MKHIKNIIIAGTLLAFIALTGSVQAETKIGTIDLRKVFDNYYKTKQADVRIKEEIAEFEKDLKGMADGYKKQEEEYKGLIDKANDQAVSSEERAKSKKAAEQKITELKNTEQSINEFGRSAQARVTEKKRLQRDAIIAEIRSVIDVKAKAAAYSLVLDTTGESVNATPLVLYTNGESDITEIVLAQLNSTAPANLKTDDKKVEEKPAANPKK